MSGNAAYTSLTDNSTNLATLTGTIPKAGKIDVNATTTRTLTANSAGLSIGGLSGGAAVALTSAGGSTTADAGGNIGQTPGQFVISLEPIANDATTTTSTAQALSAGIGSGEYNQANADIAPVVNAFIGPASKVNIEGQLYVLAGATEKSTGTVQGGNFGLLTVGAANSEASSTPVVKAVIGDNVNISAGHTTLMAQYQSLGVSASSHMSAGSLVNVAAATSTAIANDSPTVSSSIGDSYNTASVVTGGSTIYVGTSSNTNVSADFEGEDYAGVNVPGNSVATANVNNNDRISIGPNVTLLGSSILALIATSDNTIPVAKDIASNAGLVSVGSGTDGSTANACINAPGACGFGGNAGVTSITVGSGSLLTSGSNVNGQVNIGIYNADNANNVLSQGTVSGVIGTNHNFANETINDSPSITLSNATISTGSALLNAQVSGLLANSEANSITSAGGSVSSSTSIMNLTSSPSVTLTGTSITAPQSIAMNADVSTNPSAVQSTNLATASINGFTGSITATATNNSTYHPFVSVDGASSMTTGNLSVESSSPIPPNANGNTTTNPFYSNNANAQNNTVVSWVLTTVQETVDEAVGWIPFVGPLIESVTKTVTKWVETITDSTTNNVLNGNFASAPAIHMNGALYQQGGAGASLTASTGPNNQATFSGNGINATNDGSGDIVVGNIVNSGAETVTLSAPSGTIDGLLNITRNSGFPTINLVNNTTENLIINQIQPLSTNQGNPDITLTAAETSGFSTTFHTQSTPTVITVQNNSGSNVIFNDYVNNPSGAINVNTQGSILGTNNDLLEDNQASFTAGHSVGTTVDPLNVRMVSDPNPTAAQMSVQAGNDVNVNAALVGYEQAAGDLAIISTANSSISAGGAVNLNLASPTVLLPQAGAPTISSQGSSFYNLNKVNAGGTISVNEASGSSIGGVIINANSLNGDVDVTNQGGDIVIGSISATSGNANINAYGSIGYSTLTTNVSANAINLTAQNSSIGISTQPLEIDATGPVTAQAERGVFLTQTNGNLNINTITSNSGIVALTSDAGNIDLGSVSAKEGSTSIVSSGSILNTGAANNIVSGDISLTAQSGSIGVAGTPVNIQSGGQLTALGNKDVIITEVTGGLDVNSVTSINGNINLTDVTGVSLGTIGAPLGNTTITATQGSILSFGNPVNIVSGNVTLNAQYGSVGSSSAPINISSTGQLSATGVTDVDVTQVGGNLRVNSVTSTVGNVNLNVASGDADLGTVAATQGYASIAASGSILNATGAATNIAANNLNLSAQTGSIGTGATALDVNAAGQLTAAAKQSINIDQTAGPMNVNAVTSQTGNVGLVATAGNIDLGVVNATAGNTTVLANQSILNTTNNGSSNINSQNVNLTAQVGTIGASASPLDTQATGLLTAQAPQSINIAQTGGNLNIATVTSASSGVTLTANAGNLNLGTVNAKLSNAALTSSGSILDANSTAASTVNAVNVNLTAQSGSVGTATTPLDIDPTGQLAAQGNMGVFINQTAGPMNVASVNSAAGNVSLTALAGNVNLGTISALTGNTGVTAYGSILDANSTNVSTINSGNVTLTALNGSIGAASTPLPIDATGKVTAQASLSDYITQTSGTLNLAALTASTGNVNLIATAGDVDLGTINSQKGNTNITAYGSIVDTNHSASSDINANNITLTAQNGSVGVPGDLLNIRSNYANLFFPGVLNANAKLGVYLNQVNGSVFVNQITSQASDVILNAQGSILNGLDFCSTCVNVIGNNTTFTSLTGSVGQSFLPFLVNNRNPSTGTSGSNYLNASAWSNIYATEVQGNLLSNSISSTAGNIGLLARSGNGVLNQILGTQSINVQVNGSLLNIQNIGAPTGQAFGYKAPSPNSVGLFVTSPGGNLTVNQLSVFQSITTQADTTNLNRVIATNLAVPTTLNSRQANALVVSMTGSNGGVANVLNATILPCASCSTANPVIFSRYWTNTGTVLASMDWLEFPNTIVGTNAQFDNNYVKVLIKNTRKSYSPWQMFVIGNQVQTDAPSREQISVSLLNPKTSYKWPIDSADVFEYLWNYFGYHH